MWYKIQNLPNKTETSTNITINKITDRIESNKILDVTFGKLVIPVIINIKCVLIGVDPGFPFLFTKHSTSFVFCKTNVRYSQYNI